MIQKINNYINYNYHNFNKKQFYTPIGIGIRKCLIDIVCK